jgi:hypothetical protein
VCFGLQYLNKTETLCQNETCGQHIQGDSRGNVSVLEGDVIRLCEEKSAHGHGSNSIWLQKWSWLHLMT